MAFSYSEATGDGSTTVFPFSFSGGGSGYIRPEDIHVFVAGAEVFNFTLSGANQIQLSVAPAAPADGLPNVMIRRIVPKDVPYADFTRGNNFGQDQLNNTALQQLYALHEFLDGFLPDGYFVKGDMDFKGASITNPGAIDMGGNTLTGVPGPLLPSDAVPLSFITDDFIALAQYADADAASAAASAVQAYESELSAAESALAASVMNVSDFVATHRLADVIQKGPWVDDRAFDTLALANTYAYANNRLLLISTQHDVVNITLTADVLVIPGGKINNSGALVISGDFKGCYNCLIGSGSITASAVLPLSYFGAQGYGLSDTAAILTKANAALPSVVIAGGIYKVSSNVTFEKHVTIAPGSRLVIENGVTVTFNGGFKGEDLTLKLQCSGTGAVVVRSRNTAIGYPEHFGAIMNSNNPGVATANTLHINRCITAFRVTELQFGDYWTEGSILVGDHKKLIGKGCQYSTDSDDVTRLVCTSGSNPIIWLGAATYPGTVNAMVQSPWLEDVIVLRSVPPVLPDAIGINVSYCLYGTVKNVQSRDSIYGFLFAGTVKTTIDRCLAFRNAVAQGATGTTDKWYGFYVYGASGLFPSLNGGNASLFLNYCTANCGYARDDEYGANVYHDPLVNSVGFYIDTPMTDVFLESPETSACFIGIEVLGDGKDGIVHDNKSLTNVDIQIKNPILDSFRFAGLYVNQLNKYGALDVVGGYYGARSGAEAAIYVNNSFATVHILGGQALLNVAPTTAGVLVYGPCEGVNIDGTSILECSDSAIKIDGRTTGVNNCSFTPVIKNQMNSLSGAGIQVWNNTTRNLYAPRMSGKTAAFEYGVQLIGAGHTHSEIQCSGIDSTAFASGSARKVANGGAWTTTGLHGTNLVSGVMT